MRVTRAEFFHFRNYQQQAIFFDKNISIFIFSGQNAQGKTNALEAIYYAALSKSHRTNTDAELLQWNENFGRVKLFFTRKDVENLAEFHFEKNKRRKLFMNGHETTTKNFIGNFHAVLFSPEDLFLIKGSPDKRRRFLDMELSQISRTYYHDLQLYQRALKQRNELLKNCKQNETSMSTVKDLLEPWTHELIQAAERIILRRKNFLQNLNELAKDIHQKISHGKENLIISYEIHRFDGESEKNFSQWLCENLEKRLSLDLLRGSTSLGPHRDDILFSLNGIDLRTFGSQGQQRTGVLSLKLSELKYFLQETGEYPVLLLDDVMSELDKTRRTQLLDFIAKEKIQTILTTTDIDDDIKQSLPNDCHFFLVSDGKISDV